MPDPLQGKREAINRGDIQNEIRFPGTKPCPVTEGQEFGLRSCRVRIQTIGLTGHGSEAEHVVQIVRIKRERRHLLRYTPPAHAIEKEDMVEDADGKLVVPQVTGDIEQRAHIDGAYTESRTKASPHEPEAVDPAEVGKSTVDTVSQLRRQSERGDQDSRKAEKSLARQVRVAMAEARRQGYDTSPHVRLIQEELDKMKRAA